MDGFDRTGKPEQLVYEDAPHPDPGAGKVRVFVFPAGITPTELTWGAWAVNNVGGLTQCSPNLPYGLWLWPGGVPPFGRN